MELGWVSAIPPETPESGASLSPVILGSEIVFWIEVDDWGAVELTAEFWVLNAAVCADGDVVEA